MGRYSLFTVEENGYFANIDDLDSFIQPVKVNSGEWEEHDIIINY